MLGVVHAGAQLRTAGAQLVGDLAPDLRRGGVVGLEEDLADCGSNDGVLALGHICQRVPHEVDAGAVEQPSQAVALWGLRARLSVMAMRPTI